MLLTEGHCLRDQAIDLCGRANAGAERDTVDFRATSLETIYEMVANGMGCTLMPALAIARHNTSEAAVSSRPLEDGASRRVGLVYRNSYPLHEDLVLFGNIIAEHLPDGVRRVKQP